MRKIIEVLDSEIQLQELKPAEVENRLSKLGLWHCPSACALACAVGQGQEVDVTQTYTHADP